MFASCLSRCVTASLLVAAIVSFGCESSTLPPTGPGPVTPTEPLTVRSISPVTGSTAGGTQLTIAGTGFAAGATVTLNGVVAPVRTIGAGSIFAITPAVSAGGAVDVVVTNPNGDSARLSGGFTYVVLGRPTIASVSANPGSTAGGAEFKIAGTGFQNGARVTFGAVSITGALFGGELYGMTPPHAAGTVDVTVTNPDGQADTLIGGYTYVEPGSLDFNGDWDAYGNEGETFFTFAIRNNQLTGFSCVPTITVVVSPPASVINGAFSFSGAEGLITGRILTPTSSRGTLRVDPCLAGLVAWNARKR
jgi:IPT/TIG domain